jgi:hypothetical protein
VYKGTAFMGFLYVVGIQVVNFFASPIGYNWDFNGLRSSARIYDTPFTHQRERRAS